MNLLSLLVLQNSLFQLKRSQFGSRPGVLWWASGHLDEVHNLFTGMPITQGGFTIEGKLEEGPAILTVMCWHWESKWLCCHLISLKVIPFH